MQIFDSHIHLFSDSIIRNVRQKRELVRQLRLQTAGADKRTSAAVLAADLRAAEVAGALLLPTANAANVHKTNRRCIEIAARNDFLQTAGTLHPDDPELEKEIAFLRNHRVRVIKLCAFSQGFVLNGPRALDMFDAIQSANRDVSRPLAVVLDTLYAADRHFGTRPEYNIHPRLLAELANCYPGINFIGAHMGGLNAPYEEIRTHLTPRPNLFLDTSNAAHVLTAGQFCDLAAAHGPRHILFGTDWPWFFHVNEIRRIDDLLNQAGFSGKDKCSVFYGSSAGLVGKVLSNEGCDPAMTAGTSV